MPTNLFFMKKILSLIAKPVPEIASRLGVEFETPDERTRPAVSVPSHGIDTMLV